MCSPSGDTTNNEDHVVHAVQTRSNKLRVEKAIDVGCPSNNTSWIHAWSNDQIRALQNNDKAIQKIISLKSEQEDRPSWSDISDEDRNVKTLFHQWNDLILDNNLLYRLKLFTKDKEKTKQLVLPCQLKTEVFLQLHNAPSGGHLGVNKLYDLISHRFYWPGMKRDVKLWCKQCKSCAQRKPGPGKGKSPMHHVHTAERNQY